jgi:integrase
LCVKARNGEPIGSPTFGSCAERFIAHQRRKADTGLITSEQANNYEGRSSFWMDTLGHVLITDINAEFLETLRETRATELNQRGEPVTASTIQKDFIFISGVLEYARETLKAIAVVPKKLSFSGKFAVRRRGRPFLTEVEYQTLHQAAKAQCDVEGLNPRTKRQREHLYWFILISVGGALRVGETHSVRWCVCELLELQIPNGTTQEAVRMMVLGKHSKTKGGVREDAYVLFGGVFAYKQMLAARPANGKPEDLLFPEGNREGMKRLLKELDLYEYRVPASDETMTRDRKSLRPTGITLRLDKGDNLSYRDVANLARTSVQMIAAYYDQATPESSAVKVATFKASEANAIRAFSRRPLP